MFCLFNEGILKINNTYHLDTSSKYEINTSIKIKYISKLMTVIQLWSSSADGNKYTSIQNYSTMTKFHDHLCHIEHNYYMRDCTYFPLCIYNITNTFKV